jgi:hypothetical protein
VTSVSGRLLVGAVLPDPKALEKSVHLRPSISPTEFWRVGIWPQESTTNNSLQAWRLGGPSEMAPIKRHLSHALRPTDGIWSPDPIRQDLRIPRWAQSRDQNQRTESGTPVPIWQGPGIAKQNHRRPYEDGAGITNTRAGSRT